MKGRAMMGSALVALVACSDAQAPRDAAVFRVDVGAETFHVAVTDPAVVQEAERRIASEGGAGVVIGTLARGHGGFNQPWGWHLVPATVRVVDATIELCDGRPSMVEEDIDYWINSVKKFCPWGGKLAARTN